MSLRNIQKTKPSLFSTDQWDEIFRKIEPMIILGIKNLQNGAEKVYVPPVELWDKYSPEAQVSL
jgi:hypothetical protein